MMSWNFGDVEVTEDESNPIQFELIPEYGVPSSWEFGGYRQRALFEYAGESHGYIQKNTMCMQMLGDVDSLRSCCTYKQMPELEPLPGSAACEASKEGDPSASLEGCENIANEAHSRKLSLLNRLKVS
jgi:hypothetical protein